MRPLFRSLFVLSMFGVLAVHVSSGLLRPWLERVVPEAATMLDRALMVLLIAPLGRDQAVTLLFGMGAVLSVWAYLAAARQARRGKAERHQTW